jgi:hypothetical protein
VKNQTEPVLDFRIRKKHPCIAVEEFCRQCGLVFTYKAYDGQLPRRFCERTCSDAYHAEHGLANSPRSDYSDAEVIRLYVAEKLTGQQVAEKLGMSKDYVYHRLRRNGIAPRDMKQKLVCQIEGCGEPTRRYFHKRSGWMRDTLCIHHRLVHKREWNRNRRGITEPKPYLYKENRSDEWIRKGKKLLRKARVFLRDLGKDQGNPKA